jgi:hypothetical protein
MSIYTDNAGPSITHAFTYPFTPTAPVQVTVADLYETIPSDALIFYIEMWAIAENLTPEIAQVTIHRVPNDAPPNEPSMGDSFVLLPFQKRTIFGVWTGTQSDGGTYLPVAGNPTVITITPEVFGDVKIHEISYRVSWLRYVDDGEEPTPPEEPDPLPPSVDDPDYPDIPKPPVVFPETPGKVPLPYNPAVESIFAYEMEKGDSFDGQYIPHFLELNWFFGDNPVDFTSLQKIRIHGLAKGQAKLRVATNGMATDRMDYEPHYSEAQIIDLPRAPQLVTGDYFSVTNYTDVAARGISVQLKFSGRNTDMSRPEPSHVIQVLVLQTTQTGARSN